MVAPILLEGESERMLYLPQGSWTDLRSGAVIEGGRFVSADANLAQVPLYLNNGSADADALRSIFDESDAWKEICAWSED
jgi:alpha-glucosidase (family GH31 glycosyl hydrolase)